MMHLFLISMPEPSARRRSALDKVKSIDLSFEIVDGIETSKWRTDALPVGESTIGRELLAGEIGCYLAHLRAMQRIVDYGLPWGCILEDDFCFEVSPDVGLCEIETVIPADFHYIHIQRQLNLNNDFQLFDHNRYFMRTKGTPLGAAGYIISNPLAQYIVENHAVCRMPIDHLFHSLSVDGNFYVLRKPIVGVQLGLCSHIHRKILLDCGAHFGEAIASLYCDGAINEQFQVLAFEPNPACHFPERAKQFPLQIEVFNAAVWTDNGRVAFNQEVLEDNDGETTGQGSAIHGIGYNQPFQTRSIEVDCIDLDAFICQLPKDAEIHCKLDIEGAEFAVLRKLIATGTIRKIKRLYVEFHQRRMDCETDQTVDDLIHEIKSNGVEFVQWY